ncbi:MAG: outer membrane beta-barrel protein [Bryobacteraceae bacterium]
MRTLLLFFATAVSALPQFSVGVKAGVPLTDFFTTVRSPNFGFNSNTKRYIVGPSVQLGLPGGLAVELDALYRRLNYEGSGTLADVLTNNRTTGNAWEFPLLLKYRFPAPVARPFLSAGVAWDTLSGLKQSISTRLNLTETSEPKELENKTTTGFVLGAGVEVRAPFVRVIPEIRYTRWGSHHFRDAAGSLLSNRNQAEFLLGFTF